MSVVVHELSNPENRDAIIQGVPLVEVVYRYNPENCLNILRTTFGPDPSSAERVVGPDHEEPTKKKNKPNEDEYVDVLN